MLALHIAQGTVEQVCSGVIAHHIESSTCVYHQLDQFTGSN
jgi:hypothetical protein